MASRKAYQKKINDAYANAEFAMKSIENEVKATRERLTVLKEKRGSLLDLSFDEFEKIRNEDRTARWGIMEDLKSARTTVNGLDYKLWGLHDDFLKDEKKRNRSKARNQRFTAGALVKRDPDPDESSVMHEVGTLYQRRLTRETHVKNEWGHTLYHKPMVTVDCRAWYEEGAGELELGVHAIVLDNKTSGTYVQIKLGNHDVWVRRGDLIVAQN